MLTKTGTGNLDLTKVSTYSGATKVSQGTLTLDVGSQLANTPTISIASGAVINLAGGATTFNQFQPAATTLSVSGLLTVTSAGAANTLYPTTITLTGGTMSSTAAGNSTFGAFYMNNGRTITANGSGNAISGGSFGFGIGGTTLTLSTPLATDVLTASTQFFDGSGGAGAAAKSGSGTLFLTGTSTYSGATSVTGGTLDVSSAGVIGNGNYGAAISLSNSGALVFNTSTNQTLGGAISGTGSLTQLGPDTLTLSQTSSFNGGTAINGGAINLGKANALPTAGAVNVNGGVLNLLTFSGSTGPVTMTSGTISGTTGVLTSNATYIVQSGAISAILAGNSGIALSKTTTGLLTVSGANTYGGGTTIGGGTLAVLSGGSLGSGNISVTPGAVFDTSALGGGYTIGGGTLTAGRASAFATDVNGSLNVNNAMINVAAGSNSGALTIGNGNLALNNATILLGQGGLIAVGGSLTLTNTDFISPNVQLGTGTYPLFTYGGSLTGGTQDLAMTGGFLSNRQTYSFSATSGTVSLTVGGSPAILQWTGTANSNWDNLVSQNWFNTSSGSADYFNPGDNVIFSDSGSAAPSVTLSRVWSTRAA